MSGVRWGGENGHEMGEIFHLENVPFILWNSYLLMPEMAKDCSEVAK